MQLQIDQQARLDKLSNFLGYGKLGASLWFIGMEEGTGGSDTATLVRNLQTRFDKFGAVMDLAEAHDLFHWPIANQVKFSAAWHWMAKISRGLKGDLDWQDQQKSRAFIRHQLGRLDGDTFLTELLPLPRPNVGFWSAEYTHLFGYSASDQYEAAVWKGSRPKNLMQAISEQAPHYIFAYGKRYHPYFKKFFVEVDQWRPFDGGRILIGRWKATQIILTPFFGQGQLSTKLVDSLIKQLRTER